MIKRFTRRKQGNISIQLEMVLGLVLSHKLGIMSRLISRGTTSWHWKGKDIAELLHCLQLYSIDKRDECPSRLNRVWRGRIKEAFAYSSAGHITNSDNGCGHKYSKRREKSRKVEEPFTLLQLCSYVTSPKGTCQLTDWMACTTLEAETLKETSEIYNTFRPRTSGFGWGILSVTLSE